MKGTIYADYFPENKSATGAVSKGYTNTKETIKDAGKQIKEMGKQLKGLFK